MVKTKAVGKRLYVLDTNVLMHDPSALFRFHEHDIFLPMIVLEELDNNKRGPSEVARNARQSSRFMEELLRNRAEQSIEAGFELPTPNNSSFKSGRLFLQTQVFTHDLPSSFTGSKPDNNILETVLALHDQQPDVTVILVSKDINLRIKAAALGIPAEDYQNDQVLEDLSLLYSGQLELSPEFWDQHSKELASWKEEGRTYYRISGPDIATWYPNQLVHDGSVSGSGNGFEGIVRRLENDTAVVELCINYRNAHHAVWGINARNREQNFALNMLMDPAIDFVSLLGNAGTGKTLLTLAAGLAQRHNLLVQKARAKLHS